MYSSKFLKSLIQSDKATNKSSFDLTAVFLGVEPTPHFPYVLDKNGKKIIDQQTGKPIKDEVPDGTTYTFSELGTSKIIKIISSDLHDLQICGAYKISGLGYDLRSSSLIFIDENAKIDLLVESGL